MCGIAGFYGFEDQALAKKMIDALHVRGPEHKGIATSEFGSIGNARLSIIDVVGGNQPIWNEDDSIAIVANCEIYNFLELREELEQRNHTFKTHSDTEVILHAYEEFGLDFAKKIDGIFAVAIMDLNRSSIILARDRLGIKPLYYFKSGNTVLFASEAKGILVFEEVPRVLDRHALHVLLHLGYVTQRQSMFEGIKQLPAATIMVISPSGIKEWTYWDFQATSELSLDLEYLGMMIESSVKRQLISERPVGVFLSGGLDSSLVAWFAAKHSSELSTFTQRFGEVDESPYAEIVAEHIGSRHFTVDHTPDQEIALARELVTAMEHPTFGLSHTYALSKFAREKGCIVILSGLGGDELFAGYVQHWRATRISNYPNLGGLSRIPALLTDRLGWATVTRGFRALGNFDQKILALKLAFTQHGIKRLFSEKNPVESIDWGSVLRYNDHNDFFRVVESELIYDQLEGNYLKIADRMSMGNSLEMRVPLLDTPLFEYAMKLEVKAKIHNGVSKYGLRQLAQLHLPRKVALRALKPSAKGGYGFNPVDFWKRGMKDYVHQKLDAFEIREYGVFDEIRVVKELRKPMSFARVRLLWNMALTHDLADVFSLE